MRAHQFPALLRFALVLVVFVQPQAGEAEEYFSTGVPLNPFISQQAQFSNVQYSIYPTPFNIRVPLIKTGNIKAGPFKIHPHFGIAESYTDNVFRTDTSNGGGKQSEWYTSYQPGVQVQLPIMGRHKWIVDYKAYLERYSRDSTLDVNDSTASTNLVFDFPGGLTASVIGEVKNGHDYRGSATASLPVVGATTTINQFYNVVYGGELELRSQAYLKAQVQSIRWEFTGPLAGSRAPGTFGDINTRNRQERYASLAAGARIAPKTYVYMQGLLQKEDYEVNKDLDSTTYTGLLGLSWDATAKSTGYFNMGWQTRIMDQASSRGSGRFSGLYFDGSLMWRPQEQTRVVGGVYRRTNETVLGGTLYFVSTGVTLDLIHALTTKWSVLGGLRFEHDQYSDPITDNGIHADRRDDYLTLAGGVSYQIQPWLGARANYTYTERLSSFNSVEYKANQAMVSLQAQF